MSSAREDVQGAQSKLISAQHKIGELERDLELARAVNVANLMQENMELERSVNALSNRYVSLELELTQEKKSHAITSELLKEEEGWRQHVQNIRSENATLYQEIDRLRNLEVSLRQELEEEKKGHKLCKDYKQYDADVKLAQIRHILGAMDKDAYGNHETALNAAKRIMEVHVRNFEIIKQQCRDLAILRRQNPPKDEMWVNISAYAQLLQDSEDLKVIKAKLGIDSSEGK